MNHQKSYHPLASYYDDLTRDVDYPGWADFLESILHRRRKHPQTILDLGCGTGSLTYVLAKRGYHMTAVDLSADMLCVAAQRCTELIPRPTFLQQNMSKLRLMEPVDAVVCALDSLNYLPRPQAVQKTFQQVANVLQNGGLFLFDVRTPQFMRSMDGQIWHDETDTLCCYWQGEFHEQSGRLTYYIDFFHLEEDGRWSRESEIHHQRAYHPENLVFWLKEAGFSHIHIYADRKLRAPRPEEDRIFIAAEFHTPKQKKDLLT